MADHKPRSPFNQSLGRSDAKRGKNNFFLATDDDYRAGRIQGLLEEQLRLQQEMVERDESMLRSMEKAARRQEACQRAEQVLADEPSLLKKVSPYKDITRLKKHTSAELSAIRNFLKPLANSFEAACKTLGVSYRGTEFGDKVWKVLVHAEAELKDRRETAENNSILEKLSAAGIPKVRLDEIARISVSELLQRVTRGAAAYCVDLRHFVDEPSAHRLKEVVNVRSKVKDDLGGRASPGQWLDLQCAVGTSGPALVAEMERVASRLTSYLTAWDRAHAWLTISCATAGCLIWWVLAPPDMENFILLIITFLWAVSLYRHIVALAVLRTSRQEFRANLERVTTLGRTAEDARGAWPH